MVLLLFLHANAYMQRGKNTFPCLLALQEHLAAAGTRLLQVHSIDKFTTPIPSSWAVCFSGVIARCAGDCWTTLSLFLFFSSVSPYSVPLVPTFKHNKIDNEIQVLKTLFFFFLRVTCRWYFFSQWQSDHWWQTSCKNFKNLTAMSLVLYSIWAVKNNFVSHGVPNFPLVLP